MNILIAVRQARQELIEAIAATEGEEAARRMRDKMLEEDGRRLLEMYPDLANKALADWSAALSGGIDKLAVRVGGEKGEWVRQTGCQIFTESYFIKQLGIVYGHAEQLSIRKFFWGD